MSPPESPELDPMMAAADAALDRAKTQKGNAAVRRAAALLAMNRHTDLELGAAR